MDYYKHTKEGYVPCKEDGWDAVLLTKQEYQELKNTIDQLDYMNSGLKRIMTERANAKRGLRPQKQRTGYIVLRSVDSTWRYRCEVEGKTFDGKPLKKKIEQYSTSIWRTLIQTPFDANLTRSEVSADILNGLKEKVFPALGFVGIQEGYKNGEYHTVQDGNFIFKWQLIQNFKSHCWEIELYHTIPLAEVTEDLRPLTRT